jgi:hypothetical protein
MEPKESPKSMSPCPLQHETIELEISGRSVPMETNTSPIIRGEKPKADAKKTECSTALSLETIKSTNPAISTAMGKMMPKANNDT